MGTVAEYHDEINGLVDPTNYYRQEFVTMTLKELEQSGGKITRVRFLKERDLYDLSYIHGQLPSGQMVQLWGLPAVFLMRRYELKTTLVRWAQSQGVFAKGLGLLDDANWSILG